MREYSGIFLAVPFLLLIVCSLILTSPLSATGQEGRENGTLANLTAEAQISPYSSFVLLAYCPPGSLDIAECKTLIFPVLTEQPEIIR